MTSTDNIISHALIENAYNSGAPLTAALGALAIEFGYIDEAAISDLAALYSLSKAEVLGVVSYYCDFRRTKPGKHILRICQAEACQAAGGRELTQHAIKKLGIGLNQTSPDNHITLEPAYCLGLCATGPALELDGKPAAMVDPAAFDALVGEIIK
ncbi:NAD-dependent formate dehydrogenase gamma subunit [hydrothermal vent metagenome]|uniref:NAD-dependent formate dehydrogenase gamma subunit n=1 Tax=hydrothermal vent metagenome TaxID=652676 RepID=A0A3B0U4C7_9ZZZZ